MELLIHFIFQLIKIAILASIYSSVLLVILLIIQKVKPTNLLEKVKNQKIAHWFYFGITISAGLLMYSFTYWGNHGLGDGPIIPIGHGKKIENTNWTEYGYLKDIKTYNGNNIHTTKFKVSNHKLSGNLESFFYIYYNSYFVLDLRTNVIMEFKTETEFNSYAELNKLPTTAELLSFEQNYRNHWNGIRFFLLP